MKLDYPLQSALLLCFLGLISNFLFGQSIRLKPIAEGFIKPVDIASTGDQGDKRLFITEKDGKIKVILPDGKVQGTPFLDIDARVNSGANERGLLGLAFHPQYKSNGYFFVHYTNAAGHSTISRFSVNPTNENIAMADSEKILLIVNQPFNNHNAGDLVFGKNGYLYIGMGDGGSAGDPGNRSQNPKQLLGKMLRIDVNTENVPYNIPASNPYRNSTDTLPEIWAFGLRNPWRISIDTVSDALWIADVGQDRWEEINAAPAEKAGLNYGWRCYEGNAPFNTSGCSSAGNYYPPVHAYANQFSIGCSVTGGFVYRGQKYPSLYGKYIYCDFCTGIFWSITTQADGTSLNEQIGDAEEMEFATFGTDNAGELYVAGLGNGIVYQVQDLTSSTGGGGAPDSWLLFPNPVHDRLMIRHNSALQYSADEVWVVISLDQSFSVIPEVVERESGTLMLDVSLLPAGMYILSRTGKGESVRFVKM